MHTEQMWHVKTGCESDIAVLRSRHEQSIMVLQRMHEEHVQEITAKYDQSLLDLSTEDVKHRSNMASVQDAHKQALSSLEEAHHKEKTRLNRDLKKLETEHRTELTRLEAEKRDSANLPSTSITKLLHRVMDYGMEVLNMDELSQVHSYIRGSSSPGVDDYDVQMPQLMETNRQLMKRISYLESSLGRLHTESTVEDLVSALRDALQVEKRRNKDLQDLSNEQKQSLGKLEQEQVVSQNLAAQDKQQIHYLEALLSDTEMQISNLKWSLDREKERVSQLQSAKRKDARVIRSLMLKLEAAEAEQQNLRVEIGHERSIRELLRDDLRRRADNWSARLNHNDQAGPSQNEEMSLERVDRNTSH